MNKNSEIKNKVVVSVISIITALAVIIVNTSSMEIYQKVIYSIIFIIFLLLILLLITVSSFNKTDRDTYEFIKKDLENIGGMLESIRINDNNIGVTRLAELDDFANYYYGKSAVVMFSNIRAKMKFKSLCKSLLELNNFIWDNHLDNAGRLTIRVSFIGSRSGKYDHRKHETEEENKEKYQKLFIKALDDYRSFKKYCENKL